MRLQVQLILPGGVRRSVQLPDEVVVGRPLPALLSKLDLPLLDEAGRALRYELVAAEGQTGIWRLAAGGPAASLIYSLPGDIGVSQ